MKNYKILKKKALLANLKRFKSKKICAMVKSNAYGHGVGEIVKMIRDEVDYFGVVSAAEGQKVRKYTDKPILICSKTFDYSSCVRHNLEIMVDDEISIREAVKHKLKDNLHLKIDCGMNRFGVRSEMAAQMINSTLLELDVTLKSIYTHFPNLADKRATQRNYKKFQSIRKCITQQPPISFGGSEVVDYPFEFDMVRLGICMYGYGEPGLLPVMELRSYVEKVFYAKKGENIGYGGAYTVKNGGFFAIVPVGYGDGLARALSGNFSVKINGISRNCVGKICMDCFFMSVDEETKVGDEVVLMQNAEEFAQKLGTISYEVLTGFSNFRGETIIK